MEFFNTSFSHNLLPCRVDPPGEGLGRDQYWRGESLLVPVLPVHGDRVLLVHG